MSSESDDSEASSGSDESSNSGSGDGPDLMRAFERLGFGGDTSGAGARRAAQTVGASASLSSPRSARDAPAAMRSWVCTMSMSHT